MSNIFRKKGFTQPHFYPHKSGAGFTLIEFLVVIATLGLLASVVVVSTKSSKDRARIASLLSYSATIKKVLGADIVGEWRFGEGSGPSVADSSGNNNNGTWNGTDYWAQKQGTIYELGEAGKFSGDDYVYIPNSNSLRFLDQITIEAWIKTNRVDSGWMVVSNPGTYYFYFLGFFNSRPRFFIGPYGDLGGDLAFSCPSDPFVVGQWHHYVGTYNGSKMKIIVDSKEICSRDYSVTGMFYTYPLTLGALLDTNTNTSYYMFDGNIDEVKIYNRSLITAEIQQHYVEGAKKRGLLAGE